MDDDSLLKSNNHKYFWFVCWITKSFFNYRASPETNISVLSDFKTESEYI